MADEPQSPVVLLTKTYRRDLPFLADLLSSLKSTGTQLPHTIVCDDDCIGELMPFVAAADHSITVVPTSTVLPRPLVAIGSALYPSGGSSSLVRRIARRIARPLIGTPNGWWLQQVAKLGAVAASGASIAVVLDSDCVVVRRLEVGDFVSPEGLPYLFSKPASSLLEMRWKLRVHGFLKHDGYAEQPHTYTSIPQVLDASLTRLMLAHLNGRMRPWWAVMLRRGLTEFELYGCFAQLHYPDRISTRESQLAFEISPWSPATWTSERPFAALHPAAKVAIAQSTLPPQVRHDVIKALLAEASGR